MQKGLIERVGKKKLTEVKKRLNKEVGKRAFTTKFAESVRLTEQGREWVRTHRRRRNK